MQQPQQRCAGSRDGPCYPDVMRTGEDSESLREKAEDYA
jgi:hypothetical protein